MKKTIKIPGMFIITIITIVFIIVSGKPTQNNNMPNSCDTVETYTTLDTILIDSLDASTIMSYKYYRLQFSPSCEDVTVIYTYRYDTLKN